MEALAPRRPLARLALLLADVAAFNVVFFHVLRALLLNPLGYASTGETVAWLLLFAVTLPLLRGVLPWAAKPGRRAVLREFALFGAFIAFVVMLANKQTTMKGKDYSWFRVEMVKVPLWLSMFARTSPGFTAVVLSVVVLLAWRAAAVPRSRIVWAVPLVAVLAYGTTLASTFAFLPEKDSKTAFYVITFSGPLVAFTVLLARQSYLSAFRLFPLVFHISLMALSYIGVVPVASLAAEFQTEAQRLNGHGVKRLYPQGNGAPDPSFAFLRKMVLSDREAFISYGPTCGVYAIDRQVGTLRQVVIPGLLRDVQWSPDGRNLWATNWMYGDFITIDPKRLERRCSVDLFSQGLTTPWAFEVDPVTGHVWASNVTPPVVAELVVQDEPGPCRAAVLRKIDFHANGFTRFTDGAFGLHVDHARDRLWVLVGMLEGRDEMALVELELSSLKILRQVRLPAAGTLVKVHGRDSVLLPNYYRDQIHEVALGAMRVVRTIDAAPTITAIEQDDKRGLFYATSRTTGELLVVDDAGGGVLQRLAVGAKPEALRLDTATDQLVVGSRQGLFQIDLRAFLGR